MRGFKRLSLLIIAVLMALTLSACDGGRSLDAVEIIQSSIENLQNATSLEYTMDQYLTMDVTLKEEQHTFTSHSSMEAVIVMEPMYGYATIISERDPGGKSSQQIYLNERDDELYLFSSTTQGGWEKRIVGKGDLSELPSISQQFSEQLGGILSGVSNLELGETMELDGAEIITVNGTISGDVIRSLLMLTGKSQVIESLNLVMDDSHLSSLLESSGEVDVSLWIAKENTEIVRLEVNLVNVLNGLIGPLIDLDNATITLTFTGYNSVEDASVPQHVLDATNTK